MIWLKIFAFVYLTALTNAEQPKIIIIGAGSSGIAAASKLYEYGFDNVTILEAEGRIGGRVFTTRFDKNWIDVGGQWVHGQVDNIAFQMASPLGLLEIPEDVMDMTFIDSNGIVVPDNINAYATKVFFNLDDKVGENVNATSGSIGSHLRNATLDELGKYSEINETLRNQLLNVFEKCYVSNVPADDWDDISLSENSEFVESPGSVVVNWKDKGYGQILDILMKKYPNPAEELPVLNNTLLNAEVVNVNYGLIENKAVVEMLDGQKYIADHVIVTPSLGVLKAQYETLFTPSLPESKVKNIKGLAFGNVAKLFFSFDEPWWNDLNLYLFIWDEKEREEYESNPDLKWMLDLFGFAPVEHKPRLLCGWMTGPGARYMETLSEEIVFNASFALLNKFFGKTHNITKPVAFLRSTWHSNKHFRGTYSYRSIRSDEADAWSEELAAPLKSNDDKPIILFAGEATHPRHFSTVHGAIETGFREADRLKEIYNDRLSNSTFRT